MYVEGDFLDQFLGCKRSTFTWVNMIIICVISSQVADQQAAVFGQCCFDPGDVNCTMGTGSFVNINTGSYPHASVAGKVIESSVTVIF